MADSEEDAPAEMNGASKDALAFMGLGDTDEEEEEEEDDEDEREEEALENLVDSDEEEDPDTIDDPAARAHAQEGVMNVGERQDRGRETRVAPSASVVYLYLHHTVCFTKQ